MLNLFVPKGSGEELILFSNGVYAIFFSNRWTNCEAIVNGIGVRKTKRDTKVK